MGDAPEHSGRHRCEAEMLVQRAAVERNAQLEVAGARREAAESKREAREAAAAAAAALHANRADNVAQDAHADGGEGVCLLLVTQFCAQLTARSPG